LRGTTIARVAAEAGGGVGTVSRVLNGSPAVSADTRRRVLEAIATLDYQPSPTARALSTGRTNAIGVVAPFFTQPSLAARGRLDGLLAISLAPTEREARRMELAGVPIVLLDRNHPTLPCITIDDG